MKYYVYDRSCWRRIGEKNGVLDALSRRGWTPTGVVADASLVFIFTCGYTQAAINEMLGHISQLRAMMNPGARLVIGGCMPGTDPSGIQGALRENDILISPSDFAPLEKLLGLEIPGGPVSSLPVAGTGRPASGASGFKGRIGRIGFLIKKGRLLSALARKTAEARRRLGFVKATELMGVYQGLQIAKGCNRNCSYCAIRFAVGPLRSRPLRDLVEECRRHLANGSGKFNLYGDCLGDYGLDIGTHLGALLDELSALRKDIRLCISDLHPGAFLRYFDRIDRMCSMDQIRLLHVPLQSANGRILKLMRRGYDSSEVGDRLLCLRKKYKKLVIIADLLIGFPSETDADFEESLNFLKTVGIKYCCVCRYSDMPGTSSSKLPEKVSEQVIAHRYGAIENLKGVRILNVAEPPPWR